MYRFLFFQVLIKCFIVILNIWFANVLGDEVSNLYLILSSVSAVALVLDFNSGTEINRLERDNDKLEMFSKIYWAKSWSSLFFSVLLFFYFFYYLNFKVFSSLISFTLFFDSVFNLFLVKFLALHNILKYHFYSFLLGLFKIVFPLLFFYLFDSIELGILSSSFFLFFLILSLEGIPITVKSKFNANFFISILSVGLCVNILQKFDVFALGFLDIPFKNDFFIYNRFYEFSLFPVTLLIGYLYKNLYNQKILVSIYQFFITVLLFLGYVIYSEYNDNYDLMLLVFIFKFSFVVLGMFLLPTYSVSSSYDRNIFTLILLVILVIRLLWPIFFEYNLLALVVCEFFLFLVLLILNLFDLNKKKNLLNEY